MIVAFDTTVLAYAEGVDDPVRRDLARRAIALTLAHRRIVPVQVLGELFRVLVGKKRYTPTEAQSVILTWRDVANVQETSLEVMVAATDLAVAHRLQLWDAVIISAAVEARATILLSEDMHDGFSWRGLTVLNPLSQSGLGRLAELSGS